MELGAEADRERDGAVGRVGLRGQSAELGRAREPALRHTVGDDDHERATRRATRVVREAQPRLDVRAATEVHRADHLARRAAIAHGDRREHLARVGAVGDDLQLVLGAEAPHHGARSLQHVLPGALHRGARVDHEVHAERRDHRRRREPLHLHDHARPAAARRQRVVRQRRRDAHVRVGVERLRTRRGQPRQRVEIAQTRDLPVDRRTTTAEAAEREHHSRALGRSARRRARGARCDAQRLPRRDASLPDADAPRAGATTSATTSGATTGVTRAGATHARDTCLGARGQRRRRRARDPRRRRPVLDHQDRRLGVSRHVPLRRRAGRLPGRGIPDAGVVADTASQGETRQGHDSKGIHAIRPREATHGGDRRSQ